MKALQITKPYEFKIVEIEETEPKPDEVLIKLEYAAICNQNDYKIFYGLYGDLIQYPCEPGVYGHEGVGVIVKKGTNVEKPEVGDRVVMMLEGGPMLYREYVLRKANSIVKIDKKVPAEEAAVLELFGCAHHCSVIAGEVKGKSIGISGLGPAGLAILQMIRLKNPPEITAIDISDARLEFARQFNPDEIVNVSDKEQLTKLIDKGLDVVIDATGVPQSILNSFDITRKEVIIFGFTNQKFEVDQSKWFAKEMVIKNSKVQTIEDLKAVAGLLEQGKLETRTFISDIMSFNDYDKAVEKVYKKEAIKILLQWR